MMRTTRQPATAGSPEPAETSQSPKRGRKAVAALAIAAAAAGIGASPAYAGSGSVGGTLRCSWNPWGSKVTGLWTWTDTNGGRWDRYSGTQVAAGWGRDLSNIRDGGQLLHYDLYCDGTFVQHGAFTIRPGWNNRNITR